MKLLAILLATSLLVDAAKPIERRIPPKGIPFPIKTHGELNIRLAALERSFEVIKGHPNAADVEILIRAVRLALQHGELYKESQLPLFGRTLDLVDRQIGQIKKIKQLKRAHGLQVRGYYSSIDGSAQPYGLEIPVGIDLTQGATKKVPLYVWLHGRGDKTTDLHFIQQRLTKPGQFRINDGIVLHPFGRHCMGFKSAGEIDVLDAISHVARNYPVDLDRVALMGFSMGGAGAWHIGAHYTDRFAIVHAGAGFAETAKYNRLKPENFPPEIEQQLWNNYDVPSYARNLMNVPLVAYSGEIDKQKQAADLMAETLAQHNHKLDHIIGTGMAHKYDDASRNKVLERVRDALSKGRNRFPRKIHLQTRTLRYNSYHWLEVSGLKNHWKDSRADAEFNPPDVITISSKNIHSLKIRPPSADFKSGFNVGFQLQIDGQKLQLPAPSHSIELLHTTKGWTIQKPPANQLRKKSGLQGPIDDAFLESFIIVKPSGSPTDSPAIKEWIDFELKHFIGRWRALYRAEPRVLMDMDITQDHINKHHLVIWGTPNSNIILGKVSKKLPVKWSSNNSMIANGKPYDSAHHIPLLIHPNPLNPAKYLVLNSGPTHREAHDRTNSLQNPKLGDWAIIDIRTPPDAETPGRVADNGFFTETWKFPKK
jgi:dienelactone hydrolase